MNIIRHKAVGIGPLLGSPFAQTHSAIRALPETADARSLGFPAALAGTLFEPCDHLQIGAILLVNETHVLACNHTASDMNGKFFAIQYGQIKFSPRTEQSIGQSKLHARSNNPNAAPSRNHFVLRDSDDAICIGSFVPNPVEPASANASLLLLREARREAKNLLPMLIQDIGLSFAEARLAVELHKQCDLGKTAQSLGLSKETVRTQVKSVFAKLGVGKQVEVVKLLEKMLHLQF